MTAITRPGLYPELTAEEYHADPVPGGSLSSTGARWLLDSPARFAYDREHRRESLAFDVGHAAHTKVLGIGAGVIPYPPEHLTPSGKVSEKAATVAWAAEQRAAGLVPIAPTDADTIDAMAEAVLQHPAARRLLEAPGASEVAAFGKDPDTGVTVRALFDRLGPNVAADLKTTRGSASRTGFGTDAAKHGYPIQETHYLDALEYATGERRDALLWIVVEKRAPHLVAVHRFDDVTRISARDLAARARELFAECQASGEWPGYGDDVLTTAMPAWWFNRLDDELDEEMEVNG